MRPALVLLFAIVGCADPQPSPAADPISEAPTTEASLAPEPVAVTYRCESGVSLSVTYPDVETAQVEYEGTPHRLAFDPTSTAPGAAYADSSWIWLTAGSTGTLSPAAGGEAVERCEQVP